jgi:hypothetical protein
MHAVYEGALFLGRQSDKASVSACVVHQRHAEAHGYFLTVYQIHFIHLGVIFCAGAKKMRGLLRPRKKMNFRSSGVFLPE